MTALDNGYHVLRTAVAAAAEQLSTISRVFYGNPSAVSLPLLLRQQASTDVLGDSAHTITTLQPGCQISGVANPVQGRPDAQATVAAAVISAVTEVMGRAPDAGEPLMSAGLTSEGAVRLTAALEVALGHELPGASSVPSSQILIFCPKLYNIHSQCSHKVLEWMHIF